MIDSVRDYSVLFVGDDIIDEYHYVKSLGKSPKEHLIPVRYLNKEVFKGAKYLLLKNRANVRRPKHRQQLQELF